ncbi:hypothetical protein AB0J72_40240, partial [Dactylosporangium sp. NPDC049742]|uniref:hypothetical protein n=1 Tax=Dactylosporangium sp. NPDC049742 TaxID=3154737 RepID=UPI0034386B35
AAGAPSASVRPGPAAQPASPTASRLLAGPAAPRSPSPSPRPSPTPSLPSACLGAVVHRVPADTIFEISPTLCLGVGAVLEIGPSGPGTVRATPESMVVRTYEAAIHSFRFLRPGNVTITVDRPEGDDGTLIVIVR